MGRCGENCLAVDGQVGDFGVGVFPCRGDLALYNGVGSFIIDLMVGLAMEAVYLQS